MPDAVPALVIPEAVDDRPDAAALAAQAAAEAKSLSDRGLLEAIYRQNAEIVLVLGDALFAIHALQNRVQAMEQAASGDAKKPDGRSLKDEVEAFKGAIQNLVGAVHQVPEQTAGKVDERLESTLLRVVTAAPAA